MGADNMYNDEKYFPDCWGDFGDKLKLHDNFIHLEQPTAKFEEDGSFDATLALTSTVALVSGLNPTLSISLDLGAESADLYFHLLYNTICSLFAFVAGSCGRYPTRHEVSLAQATRCLPLGFRPFFLLPHLELIYGLYVQLFRHPFLHG